MLIRVLIGNASADGRSQIQQERDRQVAAGQDYPIINAGAYAEDGLNEILEVRVNSGQREILVDDCTRAQIHSVIAWQASVEDDERFENVFVHMARRN
ncbi:hypothetical protein [Pseudomonas putida]|uniref:Uncharacterized protein n=1 Tax=Pseudomonas putida TaxID=303 RepID=A0A177SRV2_PSEPU|nr:hypothetical protein [Pseudomonas putida]OAI93071.1 hypothetical protein AYO28_16360 [Pseudomonas putida]